MTGLCEGLKFWNEVRQITQIAISNKKQTGSGDHLRDHFDKAHLYLKKEMMNLNDQELNEVLAEFDYEDN